MHKNLALMARTALNDYDADIQDGGEPHYPQWAKDLLALTTWAPGVPPVSGSLYLVKVYDVGTQTARPQTAMYIGHDLKLIGDDLRARQIVGWMPIAPF